MSNNNKETQERQKRERLGEEKLNNQGCLMKIIEYNNFMDIVVEFQDKYKTKTHTTYGCFKSGYVKNPYYPELFNVGITGNKYPSTINRKHIKEYGAWKSMLERCYYKKNSEKTPTYNDVVCCDEWLLYENFYEWLHSQDNFEKWLNADRWAVDKDILVKGNKIYSPETCCLVPQNVNNLFVKRNRCRGDLPIGVEKCGNLFRARYRNNILNKQTVYIGRCSTPEEAFQVYKQAKEEYIKQVAQEEYSKCNITKRCYEAMMNYEVEITD